MAPCDTKITATTRDSGIRIRVIVRVMSTQKLPMVAEPRRGVPRPRRGYVVSEFEPHDDPDRIVGAAADAVETLDAEGLEAAQRAINARRS